MQKDTIVAIVGTLLVLSGYLLGSYLHGDRARDAAIKADILRLETNQRQLTNELDRISKSLAASQKRIATIESGIDEVAGRIADGKISLTESARLIGQGESILRQIQSRAEGNSAEIKK